MSLSRLLKEALVEKGSKPSARAEGTRLKVWVKKRRGGV